MKEQTSQTPPENMIIKSYTKKELALLYGVSRKVLRGWLKEDDDFLGARTKLFNVSKIEFIFSKHGYPKNIKL
jgi:hypothetical protein